MKFEYKVEIIGHTEDDDLIDIEKFINKFGDEEWELVSTEYMFATIHFFFKREKR